MRGYKELMQVYLPITQRTVKIKNIRGNNKQFIKASCDISIDNEVYSSLKTGTEFILNINNVVGEISTWRLLELFLLSLFGKESEILK